MAREEGTGSLSVTGLRWGLAGGSCHSSVFSVLGEFDVHKLCVRGAKAIRAVPGTAAQSSVWQQQIAGAATALTAGELRLEKKCFLGNSSSLGR